MEKTLLKMIELLDFYSQEEKEKHEKGIKELEKFHKSEKEKWKKSLEESTKLLIAKTRELDDFHELEKESNPHYWGAKCLIK